MSQRAAWQLERLGFSDVYDFVAGKSYWIASGRPTIRGSGPRRVAEQMRTEVTTVSPDDMVHAVRDRIDGCDVVVVNEHNIVLGIARSSDLDEAEPDQPISSVMRVGPTTVRPDEPLEPLQRRMTAKSVPSILVTTPAGQLLGTYHPTKQNQT